MVLTPRRRRQVCEKTRRRRRQESPISGESTKETVKTIACGNAGCPGATVVTTLVCYQHTAHEAAGATGTRHSPRPLFSWAHDSFTTRAHRSARARRHVMRASLLWSDLSAVAQRAKAEATKSNPDSVIPGRCAASNPESRDSGSGPAGHPGMTEAGLLRLRSQ